MAVRVWRCCDIAAHVLMPRGGGWGRSIAIRRGLHWPTRKTKVATISAFGVAVRPDGVDLRRTTQQQPQQLLSSFQGYRETLAILRFWMGALLTLDFAVLAMVYHVIFKFSKACAPQCS